MTEAQPGSAAAKLQAEYAAWFQQLQSLTSEVLDPDDWTGRWFDHFTPADALKAGPEDDDE